MLTRTLSLVRRCFTNCPACMLVRGSTLLMRFGFIAHPGSNPRASAIDLRFCVAPPAAVS
jgi:hypothetical protein